MLIVFKHKLWKIIRSCAQISGQFRQIKTARLSACGFYLIWIMQDAHSLLQVPYLLPQHRTLLRHPL